MKPSVIAVVATWRRAPQLALLLHSLAAVGAEMRGAIVVDNAADEATGEVLAASALPCHRLLPGRNLGCGGGLALAETSAAGLFPDFTHLWVLDDDALVPPGALSALLAAMLVESADVACPLVVGADDRIGWFPRLRDPAKFAAVCQRITPAAFLARFGPEPVAFSWATGVALLFTRAIFERVGPHRGDYWIRGEDLEFSLRLTSAARGILVPTVVVRHLPPESDSVDPAGEFEKHAAMLQNLAYTSTRVPHGRSLLGSLPGNGWRFLRTWGRSSRALLALIHALWRGAGRGEPAGVSRAREGK